MFGNNPFNEYRATQQQVQEKKVIDKDTIDGSTIADVDASIQEKTVDEAAFTKKAVETGKVKTGPSTGRMAAMQKQYDDKKKNEAVKYPHMMYDPKTGKEFEAKTPADHAKYAKMGYTHDKPKMESVQERTAADCKGMVCKNCGDVFGMPTEGSCMYDSKDPNGKNWKEAYNEATQYIIPEEIPANERTAFHGAAAAAAKAGKKSFNFGGKTHPVTMKKDTAKAIADDNVKEGMYKDMDTEKGEPNPRSDAKVKADMKKRRKTEKSDVDMNPKLDKGTKDNSMEQKESTIRAKLMAVLEGDRAKHYKGATKPETMDDKLKGKGAKDMVNQPKEVDDTEEKGHIDGVKATRAGPNQAKARSGGDNVKKGDTKIIPSATPVKGAMYKTMEAYTSMNQKDEQNGD